MWSWMCKRWNLNDSGSLTRHSASRMQLRSLSNCEDYPPFTSDCLCICLEPEMSKFQSHVSHSTDIEEQTVNGNFRFT